MGEKLTTPCVLKRWPLLAKMEGHKKQRSAFPVQKVAWLSDRNKSTFQLFLLRNTSGSIQVQYVGQLLNWIDNLYSTSKLDFDIGK